MVSIVSPIAKLPVAAASIHWHRHDVQVNVIILLDTIDWSGDALPSHSGVARRCRYACSWIWGRELAQDYLRDRVECRAHRDCPSCPSCRDSVRSAITPSTDKAIGHGPTHTSVEAYVDKRHVNWLCEANGTRTYLVPRI